MNRLEPKPSLNPTAAARDTTSEEWLDGIPPVLHINVRVISRADLRGALRRPITALISWARNQLTKVERKIGFSANLTIAFAGWDRVEDIVLQSLREHAFVKTWVRLCIARHGRKRGYQWLKRIRSGKTTKDEGSIG
jgi:hypothetical protein